MKREKGAIAIEFAFIIPLLVLMLLGAAEAMLAVNAHRRIERLCAATADMASEYVRLRGDAARELSDAVAGLAWGMDLDALDVQLRSFGGRTGSATLHGAANAAAHAPSRAGEIERGERESLVEIACSYRHRPGGFSALIGELDFATLAYAAFKKDIGPRR